MYPCIYSRSAPIEGAVDVSCHMGPIIRRYFFDAWQWRRAVSRAARCTDVASPGIYIYMYIYIYIYINIYIYI